MHEKTISEIKAAVGKNLLCAVRFGTEGEPDNFLCVLEKIGFGELERLKKTMKKRGNIVPLFFTKKELRTAADVFPLEFLDIQHPHEVLHGRDMIAEIKIQKKHVRRELESELRSKLIHLRENYVWLSSGREIKSLLLSAVPNFMPLFYGMLFLKNVMPPAELDGLFDKVSQQYRFNVAILRRLKLLKQGKIKVGEPELKRHVMELLDFLQHAISVIDKMKVK